MQLLHLSTSMCEAQSASPSALLFGINGFTKEINLLRTQILIIKKKKKRLLKSVIINQTESPTIKYNPTLSLTWSKINLCTHLFHSSPFSNFHLQTNTVLTTKNPPFFTKQPQLIKIQKPITPLVTMDKNHYKYYIVPTFLKTTTTITLLPKNNNNNINHNICLCISILTCNTHH